MTDPKPKSKEMDSKESIKKIIKKRLCPKGFMEFEKLLVEETIIETRTSFRELVEDSIVSQEQVKSIMEKYNSVFEVDDMTNLNLIFEELEEQLRLNILASLDGEGGEDK